jgi:hypothetical protein
MLVRRSFAILVILIGFLPCMAADGSVNDKVFTLVVSAPTSPKDVQVRYFLGGEFGGFFASSTASGVENKIVIKTEHESKTATSFKAIAYAPGCQFVTISVDDLASSDRQGEFQCQKLPTTLLQGRVPMSGVEGKDLQVQILYVCSWAPQFFNIGQGAISPFFLAKVPVATDGSFSIELPDFSTDPSWSSLSKDASLTFYLVDASTGHPLNALTPPAALSQGSSLKVASNYGGEVQFAVQAPGAPQK